MSTEIGNASARVFQSMQTDFELHCTRVCEGFVDFCESPIEVMIAATLVITFSLGNKNVLAIIWPDGKRVGADDAVLELSVQYPWRGYRSDFALRLAGITILIECDGHEFHERTKEQAERDRRKDREAQTEGYVILRFTGSEIYRSPQACVIQILEAIYGAVDK